MSRLTFAAAAAILSVCAAPAFAQEAPVSPPEVASAQPAPSAEEQAFQEKGTAFEAETRQMGVELQAVMEDAALDAATKKTRTDAIIAQYEPKFEAFAVILEAFLRELAAAPERAAQREQILAAAASAPAEVRGATTSIRASIDQALVAPAAPAAPATPN